MKRRSLARLAAMARKESREKVDFPSRAEVSDGRKEQKKEEKEREREREIGAKRIVAT